MGCPDHTVGCNGVCIPQGQEDGDRCAALLVDREVEALALSGSKLYVSLTDGVYERDLENKILGRLPGLSHSESLAASGRTLALVNGLDRQIVRYDLDAG